MTNPPAGSFMIQVEALQEEEVFLFSYVMI